MKDSFITKKIFAPLDDLFMLLKAMQGALDMDILGDDYVVGREQLYYVFMHETMHAFIGKASPWIYKLHEDETDFIDETAARILIDDLLTQLKLFGKVKLYYDNHINHRKELSYYGYDLSPEDYDRMEKHYHEAFSKTKDIDGLCHNIADQYRELGMKRRDGFTYKMNN